MSIMTIFAFHHKNPTKPLLNVSKKPVTPLFCLEKLYGLQAICLRLFRPFRDANCSKSFDIPVFSSCFFFSLEGGSARYFILSQICASTS